VVGKEEEPMLETGKREPSPTIIWDGVEKEGG
jgi:hypothetical protein